ncbi:MAG: hypothetical protein QXO15_10785, partial [Nitrososphaerota archaeon]
KVFLNAMRKTVSELVKSDKDFEEAKNELKKLIKSNRIDAKSIQQVMDQIPSYVFGSLVTDIAIGAIFEGISKEMKVQKMIADVFVKVFEEKGVQILLSHCNIEAAKNILGEEKVEEIAEKITTEDVFQIEEYEKFCSKIVKILEETLKAK